MPFMNSVLIQTFDNACMLFSPMERMHILYTVAYSSSSHFLQKNGNYTFTRKKSYRIKMQGV